LDTGEKFELDAGYTASTIDTLSRAVSPETQRDGTSSRGITPDLVSRSGSSMQRPSNMTLESARRPNRIDEERAPSRGLRSRSNTIEEGRVSEDIRSPKDERLNGQGHISPISQRTYLSQRTTRTHQTDQSGRSFLDLD